MKVFLFFIFFIINHFSFLSAFTWEDEDSVVIEALTSPTLLKRRGGKFPFTWPWEIGFSGRARAENSVDRDFTCYTTLGEEGVCATLRECYPMLYSTEYAKARHDIGGNPSLIDTLKSISGPCDFPNFSKFRLNMPDSLICCPSRIALQEPGTTTTKATTTTAKPTPSTTTARAKTGDSAVPLPSSMTIKEHKPTIAPSLPRVTVPDAVASHFHREYICGFKNESGMDSMSVDEASSRFPWIVALVGNRGHFCAGSLIDRYNVLTSASCTHYMTSEDVSNLQVYLGDYKLHSVTDGPLIIRKVARIIFHRGFDNQTLKNDIAILRFKLPSPVGTPRVLPVCLPPAEFHRRKAELIRLVGVNATLAGWGRNWNPSPVPVLRKATMKIWSNDDCRAKYGYLARSGITDHMLCAYPDRISSEFILSEVDMDTDVTQSERRLEVTPLIQDCVGDTGGPLVILNEDKRYEQVGIVSWNIGCSHYPYIHTRVASYLNWIEKNRHR